MTPLETTSMHRKRRRISGRDSMQAEANITHLTTAEAAKRLRLTIGTLRRWSSTKDGPLLPVRVGGRLLWPVHAIERLLSGERDEPK